ncbi:girdin isoform X1 [Fundulus heteroclitus]|uniref:girdin isoform X1 n=1 Tax=Fundulus heteroclitus TaxID=8078 RepID=UPI00165BE7B5|nr:girdin isoform X1 [Fundulus heteroclitus]
MESGVFLASLDQFMLSPLLTWVKTLIPAEEGIHLDFSDLLDGVILNKIMAKINPSTAPQGSNKVCRDPGQRIQNLNVLVQRIRSYYLDNLRQLILVPLPDVLLLGKNPYCEQSLEEMKKLLLLLLGCAVQCEKKEEYIEKIQTLDFDTKAAIAAHIQELTHSQENVLDLQWLESSDVQPEEMETVMRNMATHLQHVLDQRDVHMETIVELMQEKEGTVSLLCSPSSPQSASYAVPGVQQQPQQPQTGTQQHLAVELADSKAKIRRLRQELEEKSEQMLDCRHELENTEAELKRIQQENSQLQVDARAARTYRDELDALRERAIKADKLESEVGRYKEQLHKMEFYKAKVEELKEDNRVLQETKEVLEDQLEGWRSRTDKIHQLEKQNLLLKARVHDMEQEKEADTERMKELQEENLALCVAQRRSMEESQHLGWELEQLSKTTENSHGPQTLSEEVSERTRSQILKLEKENQRLLRTIEELRAAVHNVGTETKHSCHVVCDTHQFTSSAEQSSLLENHSDAQTLLIPNGGSNCQQEVVKEEREGVQTQLFLADRPDRDAQENRRLRDQGNEAMSDLEILENNQNRLRCFVGPCDPAPGPQRKSQCRDSASTGLPTRSSYASRHTQRLEVKCRGLDTLNQQLQTSLYNTERKAQRLEAEVQELEAENQALQASLEELRISARRLEQLETEKQNLEHETTTLERDKRQLEKENRRLRQQNEIQEASLDSRNVCLVSLEREMRLLVKEAEGLRETSERVKSLEGENRELTKQAAIDQKTLATLREELVNEKLKTQQRDNDLEQLSHELEMKVLKQESPQLEAPDSRVKMLESELEISLKRSLQIKDDKMAALEARLQESSFLNQQLRQELRAVKLSYEALQQRQEEEASSSGPPAQANRAMTEWLRESQEATRELLRLKDRLIEVERNNATLEAERQATQAQLKQLESQSDGQQAQILALQRQAASLQESNTALQTHNANLQVEKSTLNSQSASLMAQNAHLQQQRSGMESERDSAVRGREELRGAHEQLLRDHERLTVLHERQAMEYEALMGKHACLKNVHRTLELEHRTLQDRHNNLLQQKAKLEDLEKTLKQEQMRISLEKDQHQATAAECSRLRDEKDWLNRTYQQLLNDNEALTADHKLLKSQLNEAKLEHTWLEADFSKLKKESQELDISSTKLSNQCELLSQLKGNLEEENRHLLGQIETLMLQNRTLLEQNMESKDLFHVEERQYIDKLNDLRRQKEKLEEKIMDQYKFYEPSPPRRRGNWITLKLKKLMKSNSRENEPEATHIAAAEPHLCSHDNGSLISSDGSGGSACASAGTQRSSTPLKRFPRLKNRLKDRDKVKSIFRRSLSLSSLSHPSTSFEAKQDADVDKSQEDPLTSSLSTSTLSILQHHHHPTTLPFGHFSDTPDIGPHVSELWLTDKVSNGSTVPSGCEDRDGLQNHGMNVVQCPAQSESSVELSLSLENEPWSNGSSPVQQPPSRNSCTSYQPPSDTSTPQARRKLQQHGDTSSTMPTPSSLNPDMVQSQKDPVLSQDFWLTRGTKTIRRGSRRKAPRRSSDSGKTNSELNGFSSKDETAQASACSPITVLYVQGKSSSMSGCLNCFSAPLVKEGQPGEFRPPKSLPRASSVISSSEGSSRRSSVDSESRGTIQTEPAQTAERNCTPEQTQRQEQNADTRNSEPGPIPPVKPPRDPAVIVPTKHHRPTSQEPALGSSFTFNSVFSDTIFSDSELATATILDTIDVSTNSLRPNASAEQISPPERQETAEKTPPASLRSENEQSGMAELAGGLEMKGLTAHSHTKAALTAPSNTSGAEWKQDEMKC